jgi:bifunctional non-homologous end joining protein LigD
MLRKLAKVPAFIAPQLPVLSAEPPTGSGWIHEIKHDGFRTLISVSGRDARAFTQQDGEPQERTVYIARISRRCGSTTQHNADSFNTDL